MIDNSPRRPAAATLLHLVSSLCALAALGHTAHASEYLHLASGAYGITGQAAASATQGPFVMSLAAGPAGARLNDTANAGLGIDSSAIAGVVGDPAITMNRLSNGQFESVTFSFNRAGRIRDLLFDGVKDETLEYFRLDLPGGGVKTLFDFETQLRLVEQGFSLASLAVPNITLMNNADDDVHNLGVTFQAGDVFTLTYGEHAFPEGYVPSANGTGNGARWEGVVVVPEPASFCLTIFAAVALRSAGRRQQAASRIPI